MNPMPYGVHQASPLPKKTSCHPSSFLITVWFYWVLTLLSPNSTPAIWGLLFRVLTESFGKNALDWRLGEWNPFMVIIVSPTSVAPFSSTNFLALNNRQREGCSRPTELTAQHRPRSCNRPGSLSVPFLSTFIFAKCNSKCQVPSRDVQSRSTYEVRNSLVRHGKEDR
jgi:hypothetical protein